MLKVHGVCYSNLYNEDLQSKIVKRVQNIKDYIERYDNNTTLALCTIRIQMQTKDNSFYNLVETVICYDEYDATQNSVDSINKFAHAWIDQKLANYKYIINNKNMIHVCTLDDQKSKLISTAQANEVTVWFEI